MRFDDVLTRVQEEGGEYVDVFRAEGSDFASIVALNPDPKRLKVEYRFYLDGLFYVEVFYSDFYQSSPFSSFLLPKMTEYGRPYEEYATVDELGNIILHAKWDTEDSLIELISHPGGNYSLFLSSQLTLIQLEESRKTEERLAY